MGGITIVSTDCSSLFKHLTGKCPRQIDRTKALRSLFQTKQMRAEGLCPSFEMAAGGNRREDMQGNESSLANTSPRVSSYFTLV